MKKALLIFTLFVSTLTAISCSNNDDSSSEDQLVGKWKVIQAFEDDIEVGAVCTELSSYEYYNDGILIEQLYEKEIGDCELFDTLEGTWTNNNNGSYTFNYQRFSHTANVSFNDGILTISGNISDGPGTYKTVYKRQ